MNIAWDFSELFEFADNLVSNNLDETFKRITREISKQLLQRIKGFTPKGETGELIRGWDNNAFLVKEVDNGFEVEIVNETEYARWVNDGHRVKNSKDGDYLQVYNRRKVITPYEWQDPVNNYYVFGECLYGIEVKEGYIKRYMAYELDEYNCISDNCNVFLKTNELSNSHRYDSSVKFWIRKVNNYYEIEPYALPYEDSTCEKFLVTSTDDNNISLKCNNYATLNRKWLLTDELTNTNFIRLYTIKSYANSTMCISISNFNNGSNNGNQISSTGNVILKSSSQNTQWKFIAVSDE